MFGAARKRGLFVGGKPLPPTPYGTRNPAKILAMADAPVMEKARPQPEVQLQDLLIELSRVLKRVENFSHHHITLEPLSTRERMSNILDAVNEAGEQFLPFTGLFRVEEGRQGVIVTFIAVMELIKESLLDIVQSEPFAPIHVKAKTTSFEQQPGEDPAPAPTV